MFSFPVPNSLRSISFRSSCFNFGICSSETFSAARSRALPEAWLSRPPARSRSRIVFSSVRIEPKQIGFLQKIRDQLLAALDFGQVPQRLQNPGSQLSSSHRGQGPVEHGQQTGVAGASRIDQLQIGLGGGVESNEFRGAVASERSKMIDFAPELVFQIMDDRAGRGGGGSHFAAAETVQRLGLEMLAQREERLLRQKSVAVVSDAMIKIAERFGLSVADQNFRWTYPGQFVQQRLPVRPLAQPKFTRGQIGISKSVGSLVQISRPEIIGPLCFQQVQLAHRARSDDLGDVARDNLARLRFAGLVANRDSFAGFDQFRYVSLGRMIRHPAHRNGVAFG